jgi:hypothetical protein
MDLDWGVCLDSISVQRLGIEFWMAWKISYNFFKFNLKWKSVEFEKRRFCKLAS